MDQSKKRKLSYAFGGLLVIGLSVGLLKFFPQKKISNQKTSQEIPQKKPLPEDIDNLKSGKKPDVVVNTQKFTTLWRDILKTSFFKKMVNEDLLFYYDESESSLSLKGTAKRIAFEREKSMFDELLAYVLDRPMQLAYWKSYNGRLNHFMGITKRSGLTDIMSAISNVALNDKQLSIAGKREVDGEKVDIYQLDYTSHDSVFFYTLHDEIVFFSSYHLPMPSKEVRNKIFNMSSSENENYDHTLFVSTKFMSFGYQFFSPGLDTLRFQYSEKSGWSTALENGKVLGTKTLLSAIPVYPAFCSFAPFRFDQVEKIFTVPADFKGKVTEHVAVCWYENSKIFTPLFVFMTEGEVSENSFKPLFEEVVGSFEKGILSPEEIALRQQQIEEMNNGEEVKDLVKAKKFVKPFEVDSFKDEKSWKLSREISSPFGFYQLSESKNAEDMRSKKFFKVTLAHHRDFLFFSADDKLVEKALSTLQKTYPNVKDMLKGDEIPLFLLDPFRVSKIVKETSLESLPEGEEALFRDSLIARLFPAFEKMGDVKPILGSLSAAAQQQLWSEVEWRTYSSR
jgi:uncharacterized protein YfaA (DUF2138 family)